MFSLIVSYVLRVSVSKKHFVSSKYPFKIRFFCFVWIRFHSFFFCFFRIEKRVIEMFGSIATYLNAVQRTWAAQDGDLVATFLSLRDRHAINSNLHVEYPENLVERIVDPPIDEILSAHIKVLYYLAPQCKINDSRINEL